MVRQSALDVAAGSGCLRLDRRITDVESRWEMLMTVRSTESRSIPTSGLDGVATSSYDPLLALARIALGAIFMISGFQKLTTLGAFSASLAARGVPAAEFW